MKKNEKPMANPSVVLREEFDDWAVLFDPDTGYAFGLNPTGVLLWKLLDGKRDLDAVLEEVRARVDAVPDDAAEHIASFVDALVSLGLAGLLHADNGGEKSSQDPCERANGMSRFTYEPPNLVNLNGQQAAYGANCTNGSGATNTCSTGSLACSCSSGTGRSPACCTGACHGVSCCSGACDSIHCNSGSCTTYCFSGSSVQICNPGSYPTGGNCWAGTGGA